ncbi:MAG: 2-isopropylmalate synthase [Spirochaetia bacterium]|nr:2-isopropylmalate synthase [Spirochaetota bacterium]MCX8096766.1 2-isopropylmalate synthase [Spirochaetota bacterium]MDW8112540.1 2-isopropylmalate synthase [Spirochaetia bacterium]
MDKRRIYIFDTTLRDGEQSPGASMSSQDKLVFAKQLANLGVDIIEAGFPISSPIQFEGVKMIAEEVEGPTIAALARAVEKDIKSAYEALRNAKRKRIHTFIATSPIHMEYKLKKTPDEVLKMAVEAVRYAKSLVDDVEFSAEDATRSDINFLKEIFLAVIDAGATTINIPDTVGYTTPFEFYNIVRTIKETVGDRVNISVHCHNDLGLAVANSLSALLAGANQVEVSVNGIGERAGNASLEEIVMTINVRNDIYPFYTNVNTKEIFKTSKLLISITGLPLAYNKPIVGRNVFAHESGIHQDGVLKYKQTYEIMKPEDVGRHSSEIILGRHSGRHALKVKFKELGITYSSEEEFEEMYKKFLEIADKKKNVYEEDLVAIFSQNIDLSKNVYSLVSVQIMSGDRTIPTSTVVLKKGNREHTESATGNGPVDATFKAIDRIVGLKDIKLEDFSIHAVTSGKDAIGEVNLSIQSQEVSFSGHGTDTDIIVASAKAYLNAINKALYYSQTTKEKVKVH